MGQKTRRLRPKITGWPIHIANPDLFSNRLYYKDKDLLSQAAAITHSTVSEVLLTPEGSLLKLADGSTLPLSQVQAISAGS